MTRCMDGAGGQKQKTVQLGCLGWWLPRWMDGAGWQKQKISAARLLGMVPASMDGWLHVVGIGLAAFEPFTRKLGASEWEPFTRQPITHL